MKTVNYLNRPLNKNLYIDSGDYIVMVVAGPNARNFHYNETEELFYQGFYNNHHSKWRTQCLEASCR
jgi:hypothetical protein